MSALPRFVTGTFYAAKLELDRSRGGHYDSSRSVRTAQGQEIATLIKLPIMDE
jgi:hypothetical protein